MRRYVERRAVLYVRGRRPDVWDTSKRIGHVYLFMDYAIK